MITFTYGTMASGKSAEILLTWWKIKDHQKVCLIKPSTDTRNGKYLHTRFGDQKVECELFYPDQTIFDLLQGINDGVPAYAYDVVIIDEAQFLSDTQINQIYGLSCTHDIVFKLYGLKNDFKGLLFNGTKKIFEIADEIKEVEAVKCFCGKDAKQNAKIENGKMVTTGNTIDVGYHYVPVCNKHFFEGKWKK